MRAAGVDVAALAKHLDVSYQAVRKVLAGGSRAFNAENNALAAARLGVSPDWLATGVGSLRDRPLSPLALDLARSFDALPVELRQQVHAHLMYTIDLASKPRPAAAPPAAPATELPPRHR